MDTLGLPSQAKGAFVTTTQTSPFFEQPTLNTPYEEPEPGTIP